MLQDVETGRPAELESIVEQWWNWGTRWDCLCLHQGGLACVKCWAGLEKIGSFYFHFPFVIFCFHLKAARRSPPNVTNDKWK